MRTMLILADGCAVEAPKEFRLTPKGLHEWANCDEAKRVYKNLLVSNGGGFSHIKLMSLNRHDKRHSFSEAERALAMSEASAIAPVPAAPEPKRKKGK